MIILLLLALFAQPPRPPALVAFGDSITVGYSATGPGWAALYAAQRGLALENMAVSRTATAEQVARMRAYDGAATDALWLVCANDLHFRTPAATFQANVQAGVDVLRAKGLRVLLNRTCPPFPRVEQAGLVAAYEHILAGIQGASLIDLPPMPPGLFPDGTHPDDAGHRLLAFAYLGRWKVWMPIA